MNAAKGRKNEGASLRPGNVLKLRERGLFVVALERRKINLGKRLSGV